MPEDDGLMRVFWPTDLPRSDCRGVVVGWRNSALDVLVVAVLEEVEVCAFRLYNWLEIWIQELTLCDSLDVLKTR